jgi:hypothetical protein
VTCLLARGHLLFEDQPGVGKTMLSQSLAQALGLGFRRVQFTSDLLPADILGASVYDRDTAAFHFHRGPVFTQVLLADEINRATPKTQSALLEAMEEGKVTADGATHALPEPFFVIATQNPSTQIGTFMLPESQMDRFLMRLALGVPDRTAERALLEGQERRELLRAMEPAMSLLELQQLQTWTRAVHASPALLDYLQDLLAVQPRAGARAFTACGPGGARRVACLGLAQWACDGAAGGHSSRGRSRDGASSGACMDGMSGRGVRQTAHRGNSAALTAMKTRVRWNRHTLALLAIVAGMWYAAEAQSNGAAHLIALLTATMGALSWLHARANLRGLSVRLVGGRACGAGRDPHAFRWNCGPRARCALRAGSARGRGGGVGVCRARAVGRAVHGAICRLLPRHAAVP